MQASKKGGANRALYLNQNRVNLNTPDDIKNLIGMLINDTLTGVIPIGAGSPMVYMCKIWLEAYEIANIEPKMEEFKKLLEKKGLI